MRYLSRSNKRELTKLAVLTILSEPLYQDRGAGPQDLGTGVCRGYDGVADVLLHVSDLLPGMIEEGLIRKDETKKSMLHFITEAGSEYLEAAKRKALFPELEQRNDWSKREVSPALIEGIAGVIRNLPEFRDSDDKRIQEASQQLAEVVGRNR